MFDLDPRLPGTGRPPALSDRVFDWVNGRILDGTLSPGQWVSENEVADILGVSRSPVREAFAQLVREGLLEVRRRRGTVIAELSAQDASDLYELRQLIDSDMVRRAVKVFTTADVEALESIVAEARRVIGDRMPFFDCTRKVWQLIMDRCPNRAVCDVAAMLWRQSIRMRGLVVSLPDGQRLVLEFFEELLDAAKAGDADRAARLMAAQQGAMRELLLRDLFIQTADRGLVPKLVPEVNRRLV
ncbi:GntR family transcriptional regulator [Amycolatopsis panacis]|uniref:GntR family transcriptional regulator n=1 Tax=Amycolatopsis panacis TaxID=2340917 RepID=UPI0011C3CFCB|nr:GntR family transcriptional regulator [Amycolatopsis panacis]